jgi:hypothetical protein
VIPAILPDLAPTLPALADDLVDETRRLAVKASRGIHRGTAVTGVDVMGDIHTGLAQLLT